MTSVPLHMFVQEPAFEDKISSNYDPTQGGAGILSSFSRTYFRAVSARRDPRTERTTDTNLGAETRARLWVDPIVSKAELDLLDAADPSIWDKIFDLVDNVGFSFLPQQGQADLNARLQNSSDIYVADTLRFDTGIELATVHRTTGTTTDIIIPRSARIQIQIPLPNEDDGDDASSDADDTPEQTFATQEIWFWYHDDAFKESYPNSYVTEVLLPLLVDDLLRASLTDKNRNVFNSGNDITTRHQEQLNTAIQDTDSSGAAKHTFCVKGRGGTDVPMPFVLVYKGQPPDRERVRQAIVDHLLASGVGSRDDWKERIPDLFIDGQMFLVPVWDNTVKRPSTIIQSNVVTIAQLIDTVLSTLPQIDRDYAIEHSTVFTASYEHIPIIAVPHPDNVAELDFRDRHITFQPTRTTDPSFVLMDEETKDLSITMNKALAVAAEKSTDEAFQIVETQNGLFVPFTVKNIEYMLMTPETFTNKREGDL